MRNEVVLFSPEHFPHMPFLQEEERAVLVIVDVHGGKVLAQGPRSQSASSAGRMRQCATHQVDYQLFASRPGLHVRQVSWGVPDE